MSLFERLKNKRQNIYEVKKSFPSGSFDPANQEGTFVKNEKNKNINPTKNKKIVSTTKKENQRQKNQNPSTRPSDNKPKRGSTTIRTSTQLDLFTNKVEPPKLEKVKTTYKPRVKKKVVSSDPTIPGIDDESTSSKTTATKTKKVNQAEVSKKAKDFTKEINKKIKI